MADIRVDVEQIAGLAAPLARVERHYLHQAPGAHEARSAGVEPRVLRQQNTHQKSRPDVAPPAFPHDRARNPVRPASVPGVPAQYLSELAFVASHWMRARCRRFYRLGPVAQYEVDDFRDRGLARDDYGCRKRGSRDAIDLLSKSTLTAKLTDQHSACYNHQRR